MTEIVDINPSRPFELVSDYEPAGDQPTAIKELLEGLEDGLARQTLLGVTGSGKTFTIANIIEKTQRPTIIMAHNKTLAAQLYGEMREYFPNNSVEYFVSYYDYYQPEAYVVSSDTYIEKDASVNSHIERMRLSATKALMQRSDSIIVATVSAIYGLGDPEQYLKMVLHLDRGEPMKQREILRRLTELQFKRNEVELSPGNYRVRGDVIDIFPAESEREAVRVELFDEEIENISLFDPLTGELIKKLPRYTIFPKSHYVTPKHTMQNAVKIIMEELRGRLIELREQNKLVEAQRLEQRTLFDIEMINELGYCTGIENYSRYLSGRNEGEPPPTLLDYLPHNGLLVVDESHVSIPQFGGMYKGDRSRKENLVKYGFRLPSALDNRPLRFDEFEKITPQTIYVSATPAAYELEGSDHIAEQVVRPTGLVDPEIEVRPADTQVDDCLSEIHKRVALNERVLITTLTKRMSEDLTEYLHESGVRVRYLHSDIVTVERTEIIRDLRLGKFDVLVGINLLREGLDMPEVSLVAIFDADKEGFLRSERSLIQTIGRAARNINGRAILYANKITKSMKKAIDETARRRTKQLAHNKKHNITPKSIRKLVTDVMEGAYDNSEDDEDFLMAAEPGEKYDLDDPKKLNKLILNLDKTMHQYAKDLEFEKAAKLRDKIQRLRQQSFGIESVPFRHKTARKRDNMKLPKVSTDIQIRYSDIDQYGHVSNSVYSQYFDIGRIHFFTELRKITEVPNMVIVSIKMDMLKEIRFKDQVVIKTRCSKMGNKSMTFEQNIFSNNKLAAKGVVISAGFNPETRKAIMLPEDWQESDE